MNTFFGRLVVWDNCWTDFGIFVNLVNCHLSLKIGKKKKTIDMKIIIWENQRFMIIVTALKVWNSQRFVSGVSVFIITIPVVLYDRWKYSYHFN